MIVHFVGREMWIFFLLSFLLFCVLFIPYTSYLKHVTDWKILLNLSCSNTSKIEIVDVYRTDILLLKWGFLECIMKFLSQKCCSRKIIWKRHRFDIVGSELWILHIPYHSWWQIFPSAFESEHHRIEVLPENENCIYSELVELPFKDLSYLNESQQTGNGKIVSYRWKCDVVNMSSPNMSSNQNNWIFHVFYIIAINSIFRIQNSISCFDVDQSILLNWGNCQIVIWLNWWSLCN